MIGDSIIDVDCCQQPKRGQFVAGDVFMSRKIRDEGRVMAVLSDGLGSGVKASVLANMTATMALQYTEAYIDPRRSAQTIMDTLPICEVRKISYSTFTIVDMNDDGETRVTEHGNPPFILLRRNRIEEVEKNSFTLEQWRDRTIYHSCFRVTDGDRLVFFSDGVTQSGMGTDVRPLGWGEKAVVKRVQQIVTESPNITSRKLAEALVNEAIANDGHEAMDDVTCAVITIRPPKYLLVVTGPPFDRARDGELAECIRTAKGKRAICGGTTANILARELDAEVTMDLSQLDPEIPPMSLMDGVELVTEGFLTLARTAELLDKGRPIEVPHPNAADKLAALMLEADIIEFIVGTRINEAHQDPNVPVELDLRRNVIRRILTALESKHQKQGMIRFL